MNKTEIHELLLTAKELERIEKNRKHTIKTRVNAGIFKVKCRCKALYLTNPEKKTA